MARSEFTSEIDQNILKVLGNGPLSTSELAKNLRVEPAFIYRRCRKLKNESLLDSSLEEGTRLLFCVDCREVVTGGNYSECKGQDLRFFFSKIRVWSLKKHPASRHAKFHVGMRKRAQKDA